MAEGHGTPMIFLSHSGCQKAFAEQLYHELLHVNHHAFFDQDPDDSLPRGTAFPQLIVQAARRCKLGVVVLSHEYIGSKWPMLELEQLLFHSSAEVYPLFFQLTPGDLASDENLGRWQSQWDAIASTSSPHDEERNIDTSMWPRALERLRYLSGEVFVPKTSQYAYIQKIVSNICKKLPPLPRVMLQETFIKGKKRLAQIIAARFEFVEESSQDALVSVLGLFGVGGIGKTTLCKNMAEFYNAEYTGRSWCLELPSADGAEEKIVEDLRKALRIFTQTHGDGSMHVTDVDQAIGLLNERVQKYSVFLAVDNVSDCTFEIASKLISDVQFGQGSKLLVTSRSRQLLNRLLPPSGPQYRYRCSTVSVPSITESEAMEALIAYSGHKLPHMQTPGETLDDVVQWCFFGGMCHPLLLKAMGAKLRAMAGAMSNEKAWKNYISKLLQHPPRHANDGPEKAVVSVLRKSFQDIPSTLQNTFLDLLYTGLFIRSNATTEICEWLCLLHEGCTQEDMWCQLIELEYHGLLELEDRAIRVHDLYRYVAEWEARACGRYLLEAFSIAKMDCRRLERIRMAGWQPEDEQKLVLSNLKHCCQAKLLQLCFLLQDIARNLTLEGMATLRILEIETAPYLEEVKGWNQAPNLVSVKLLDCPNLKRMGDMRCLSKLQELLIYGANIDLQDVGGCFELQKLELGCNQWLKNLSFVESLQELRKLVIESCSNLVDVSGICSLPALQELRLNSCHLLKEFPYIRSSNLRILVLSSCDDLEVMHGSVFALNSLEVLELCGCSFSCIPSLKNLDKLKTLKLSLENCENLGGIEGLVSLEVLSLSFCYGLKGTLNLMNSTKLRSLKLYKCQALGRIEGVNALESLEIFELSFCNNLGGVPDVKGLVKLNSLKINHCWSMARQLRETRGVPSLEHVLKLSVCTRLQSIPDLKNLVKLDTLILDSCPSLTDIQGVTTLVSLEVLELMSCCRLRRIPHLLASLTKLNTLKICKCNALEEIEGASALVNLPLFEVSECCSFRPSPDVRNALEERAHDGQVDTVFWDCAMGTSSMFTCASSFGRWSLPVLAPGGRPSSRMNAAKKRAHDHDDDQGDISFSAWLPIPQRPRRSTGASSLSSRASCNGGPSPEASPRRPPSPACDKARAEEVHSHHSAWFPHAHHVLPSYSWFPHAQEVLPDHASSSPTRLSPACSEIPSSQAEPQPHCSSSALG